MGLPQGYKMAKPYTYMGIAGFFADKNGEG